MNQTIGYIVSVKISGQEPTYHGSGPYSGSLLITQVGTWPLETAESFKAQWIKTYSTIRDKIREGGQSDWDFEIKIHKVTYDLAGF